MLVVALALPGVSNASTSGLAAFTSRLQATHHTSEAPAALARSLVGVTRRGELASDTVVATFEFRVEGSPYTHWSAEFYQHRNYDHFLMYAVRKAAQGGVVFGDQVNEWDARLPTSDVRTSPLRRYSVDTGSDLGAHGSIDLRLSHAKIYKDKLVCPTTHKLLYAVTDAYGTLRGNFDFDPELAFLPASVQESSVKAHVQSFRSTNHRCGGGGHGHGGSHGHGHGHVIVKGHFHCSSPTEFTASDDENSVGVETFGTQPLLFVAHADPPEGLIQHLSAGEVVLPSLPISVDHGALTIDASRAGPMFDGSLTFTRTGPAVKHGPKGCVEHRIPFVWYGGTVHARLDTGKGAVHGPSLQAEEDWSNNDRAF